MRAASHTSRRRGVRFLAGALMRWRVWLRPSCRHRSGAGPAAAARAAEGRSRGRAQEQAHPPAPARRPAVQDLPDRPRPAARRAQASCGRRAHAGGRLHAGLAQSQEQLLSRDSRLLSRRRTTRSRRRAGASPPGGLIMIHGLPNGVPAARVGHPWNNWTNGCIAVTNREMDEIWSLVDDGTTIIIYP